MGGARLEPGGDRLQEAMSRLGVEIDEPFRTFANGWWASRQLGLDASTVSDYEWRVRYLHRFFDRYRLGEITTRLVDRFRDELHDQATTIRNAQERAQDERRHPLMEAVTNKRGRTYQRRRRPLSNTSINAMIKLLGQILQQAVDYELIPRNPVRVGQRSARFLPRVRPTRTFLEIDEFHDLLDAAGELEVEARSDRQGLGRRAMCATLGLAGFRIREMLDLLVVQVDLARSRFKLADAKTEGRDPRGRDDAVSARRAARVCDRPPCPESPHGTVRSFLRHRERAAARPRPVPRPDPVSGGGPRQREPRSAWTAAAAADHAAFDATHLGDLRRERWPRPEADRVADRTHRPGVHVLRLSTGRHPSAHRRAGHLDGDEVRGRAGGAGVQPADHEVC